MDFLYLSRSAQKWIFLVMVCTSTKSQALITDVKTTSTEHSIILTFTPNFAATNYTASFRLSQGIFWKDFGLQAPYNDSGLTVTYNNLLPGSRYIVEVFENETKTSNRVFEEEVATVPLKPESVTVVMSGTSFMVIQWMSTYNFTYEAHEIHFMRENSTWQFKLTDSKMTFNLTDLDSGYNYNTFVVALTAGVKSQNSEAVTASTLPVPPVNLTARALGTDQIKVIWMPQPSTYQEAFQVMYSVEGSVLQNITTCGHYQCTLTPGPPAGQVINLMVVAVSHGHSSQPASIRTSTTPGIITDLMGTPGVRSLDLSWSAPANSVQDSYEVTISTIGSNSRRDFNISATNAKITFILNSLLGGDIYKVEVRALTLFAIGDARADLFMTIPESVVNLTGQAVNTSSVEFAWKNPKNSKINFINITIMQPDRSVLFLMEKDAQVEAHTVTDLIPGQEYHVVISIHSQYSSSKETAISLRTKPVKPQIVAVAAMERRLDVTLKRSEDKGVFDSIGASLQALEHAQISDHSGLVTFTDLDPGTQYRIVAFTLSGRETSEYIYESVYTKPRPPSHLSVVPTGEHGINAAWVGPDIGGYDNFTILLMEMNSITLPQTQITKDMKVEFSELHPGTTYNMSVITNKGNQFSSVISALNTTTPLPVSHIRVSLRAIDMVTITWDAPIGSGLSGYAITFDILNMSLVSLNANITQYKLTGLKPDSNYTLKLYVYSQHDQRFRHYSKEAIFNFFTYPETVAGLQKAVATSEMIIISWTVPVNVKVDLFNVGIKSLEPQTQPHELALNVLPSGTNATFNGLRPGHKYMIAIRTAKVVSPTQPPQYGSSVRLAVVTKPLAVENLQVVLVNSTTLAVSWTVNTISLQESFLVINTANNLSRSASMQATNMSSFEMYLTELYAGFEYIVTVIAQQSIEGDRENSTAVTHSGYTTPLPVTSLILTFESSDLRVSWTAPTSGNWSSYKIKYRPILHVSGAEFRVGMIPQSTTNILITDLFPGEGYQVKVTVFSHDLESNEVEASAVLRPKPPKDLDVLKNRTTTTSVTIRWIYNHSITYTSKWSIHINGEVNNNEVLATEKSEYSFQLDSLEPGQTYNIMVTSIVNDTSSQPSHINVTTKPAMNSVLEQVASTNSSITISYSNNAMGIYDYISFSLEIPEIESINRTRIDLPLTVFFTGLQAGTKYTIHAFAVSKGEISSPAMLEVITDPIPVAVNLTAHSNFVKLILGSQVGKASQYKITCTTAGSGSRLCGEKTVTSRQQEVTFSALTPFQEYKFVVTTMTEILRGDHKQIVVEYDVMTAEAPPSAVVGLSVRDEDLHTVVLTWMTPEMTNGIVRSYTVSYNGIDPSDPELTQDKQVLNDISKTTTSLKLDNLRAGFEYSFQVSAVTIAAGEVAETNITMKTAEPVFQSGMTSATSQPKVPEASEQLVTDSKISYIFTKPFTNDNGYVRYTVVVSKDKAADDKATILPSWKDARKDSNIKVYQAMGQCQDFFMSDSSCRSVERRTRSTNFQESVIFVVGAQTTAECEDQQFCNGPLVQNTEYYVKLRGYTASGLYKETDYSEKVRTAIAATSNAGIIGAVVGSVAAIFVLVTMAVFIVYCRQRPKRATKHTNSSKIQEHSLMTRVSRPVKLSEFPYHVHKMVADSDFKYAEEYEDLKEVGRGQLCLAAELPPNRPKNRFTNILPYDHSRVKLLPIEDEEGSDYINANYMPGYIFKREYVATQGPLPSTGDDFWRMVWEQNSHNIVMLTRCKEKGKEKSDHYWPNDSEPKYYGSLHVHLLSEVHMPDWTITELRISLGDNSRNIRHFFYKVWPDFGVPKNPISLIRFVRTVREQLITEPGPMIVHCSAGVGRSGTFIVLDHVLQLIREKEEVDIFGTVYKLRQERVLMVQTEQQYKFIHECLLCVLEGREEDTIYANLSHTNKG